MVEVWGHGAMLLFSLCVSVSYILGALVANDIEPGAITAARFLIGAIIMGTLLLFSKSLKKEDFKRNLKLLCNIILVPTSSRLFGKFISAHNPFNALTLPRSFWFWS